MPRNKIQSGPYDTPQSIVKAMLDLAGFRAGERLLDFGHGDGRIVIEAVRRGGYGIGVERNLERYEASVYNCRDHGLDEMTELISGFSVLVRKRPRIEPRITLIYGRIEDYLEDNAVLGMNKSLPRIQVVFSALNCPANDDIRPYLEDPKTGLPDNARVVSYDSAFHDWKSAKMRTIRAPNVPDGTGHRSPGIDHKIYLYNMRDIRESMG